MRKLTWKAAVSAAAIAAGVAIPMAAKADTVTTNGVTWTYVTNNDGTRTITLGDGKATAMPVGAEWEAAAIPGKFVIDGETYTVTRFADNAFNGCTGLKGDLRIPYSVTHGGNQCFRGCTGLTGIASWGGLVAFKQGNFLTHCTNLKGPLPSFSQFTGLGSGSYTNTYAMFNECTSLQGVCINGDIKLNVEYMFRKATSMKILLAGPNTLVTEGRDKGSTFNDVESCKAIVPSAGWAGWKTGGLNGGSNINVTYYGPDEEITSLSIDEIQRVVAMTPTTPGSLVKAMELAPLFKNHLDLDTRINVMNTLDLTGVTITPAMVSGVTFDRLMFSAKTQAQLNAILDAFPATTPISIDPTGLTEKITIPETYSNVHVKIVSGVTIRRTVDGFIITFK